MDDVPAFLDEHHLRIGEHHFHCDFPLDEIPNGRLPVMKTRDMVEHYIELCQALRPKTIFELGIRRGGSTALLSVLTEPEKLVAIEISKGGGDALDRYIEQYALGDTVRPLYGVDQADRARLAEIMAEEFGGEMLDLIIDDASHFLAETRSSFESLFPHLRPGGLFVLEDWSWQHVILDRIAAELGAAGEVPPGAAGEKDREPPDPPLASFVVELVLARASSGEAVEALTVGEHWVVVRRGQGRLDPATFRIADLYRDHYGLVRDRTP